MNISMHSKNDDAPKVSVIIPCYKDASTLKDAIDSVSNQSYGNIEIIVVNDASPETLEIEKVIGRHPGVIYIKNDINMGLAASRNVGISNCNGEYVAFLDADDEWHPRKLELQMRYVSDNTAIACDVEEFLVDPPKIRVIREDQAKDIKVVKSNYKFSFKNYLTGASLLAPKSLLFKVGGYDQSLRSCEDYDLWLRLLEGGATLIHLRLPLYLYRFNTAGLSKNVNTISFWELEVMKRHLQRNRKRPQFVLLRYPIWAVWLLRHLVRASTASNDELRKQTLENAKSPAAPYLLYYPLRLLDILGVPRVLQVMFGLGMPLRHKKR
jgi:glycosyltransferase involved in cell wall biosynthesis